MASQLPDRLSQSLRLGGSGNPEIDRLVQENQDLKRQLSGASSTCHIPYEDLEMGDQIGGGGFSLVYRGYWKGTPVAIKKWFDPNMTEELIQEFREEVNVLQQLRHPNVIQFLGASMRPPNLAMVTEHMPHSLHTVLYNMSGVDLDRKRLVSLAQDIARAFVYLHSRRPAVVHKDIKPANFLVDRQWRVKVCDFGLASNSRANAGAGTPHYMAPELFEGRGYNEKVDVYAFGVMLNEMLAREIPYSGLGVGDIRNTVLSGGRPDIPISAPRALSELIKQCWAQDPSDRPSFEKALDVLKQAMNNV